MQKFIIWADGRNAEATVIDATDMSDAIEIAEGHLNVTADEVNVIDASRTGEADYHTVAHAL